MNNKKAFRFIDLFAGIGGLRLPFDKLGGECVFSSEIDKYAQKTYFANYGELPQGDITLINANDIPDHDLLLAGFPCQAFSQAGKKQGFYETRGTLFFEIQRILVAKRPKIFLLENVKRLKTHNNGETFQIIQDILTGKTTDIDNDIKISEQTRQALNTALNYWIDFKVLNARDYGVPQNRERIFIIGLNKKYFSQIADEEFAEIFRFPEPTGITTKVGDILEEGDEVIDSFTLSDKMWEGHQRRKNKNIQNGKGFGFSLINKDTPYTCTIPARYYKDGSEALIDQSELGKNPRMLTVRECARLQGFPDEFVLNAVSKVQAYKQLGNSVCVPVVRAIANNLIEGYHTARLLQDKRTSDVSQSTA